jgi:hypothetical protein
MGGSITVGTTTFPFGTPTEAVALNDANNFTYGTGSVSSNQKQVVANGFITFGAADAGFNGHNWDLVLLNDTNSSAAVILQLNNGQSSCYCVHIETNGTGGLQRSANITITPGNRYSFSLLLDEIGGQAKLAIFDPTNGFAQVGATVQVAQNTGFNFTALRFGNAETGTYTGTTYFENLMLDWTNHVFPKTPTSSWTSFYTPFTYPHPLVGSTPSPIASFAPTSLSFPPRLIGSSSASVAVVLTNTGIGTMNISAIGFSGTNPGDFSQTNNCGASVAQGANCTINVTFTPTAGAARAANLSVSSNTGTSPDTIPLTGIGSVQVMKGNGLAIGNVLIKVSP